MTMMMMIFPYQTHGISAATKGVRKKEKTPRVTTLGTRDSSKAARYSTVQEA